MPTVIDSLVVELGLDPKNFNQQQREALTHFKRTQEEAEKGAKATEDAGRRVSQSVQGLRTQAIELFAAFSGGKTALDFFVGVTKSNAELGRMERNIGVSASTINKWQGAARIFGGDAASMAASFTSLSDAFAGWKVGIVSPIIADLRAIGTAGGTLIDMNKGVAASFLDLAENMKVLHDRDPAQAGLLGRKLGLDPAFVDLLIRGREGMKEVLDYVEKIGLATKHDTDAFGELEKRINQMGVKADSLGRKNLSGVASFITEAADVLNMTPGDAWKYLNRTDRYASRNNAAASGAPGQSLFSTPTGGAFTSSADKIAFAREEAARQGQNPDVWERLVKSEGAFNYYGDKDATGRPTSFGSMQLHYPGIGRNTADGLGTKFTKETGLDARDPATEREQIKWSIAYGGKYGLSPWHGYKGGQFDNMSGGRAAGGGGTTVQINGPITVNAPTGDGNDIVSAFRNSALKRQSEAAHSNDGQN